MKQLTITSTAFKQNEMIPTKYTCKGENINPDLSIEGIPKEAKSLVLIMDDPDAPKGTFVHWVMYNIDPKITEIKENTNPGLSGENSAGQVKYTGPCPPSGIHRYFFKVYALDFANMPQFEISPNKTQIESFMKDHVIAKGELIGRFQA